MPSIKAGSGSIASKGRMRARALTPCCRWNVNGYRPGLCRARAALGCSKTMSPDTGSQKCDTARALKEINLALERAREWRRSWMRWPRIVSGLGACCEVAFHAPSAAGATGSSAVAELLAAALKAARESAPTPRCQAAMPNSPHLSVSDRNHRSPAPSKALPSPKSRAPDCAAEPVLALDSSPAQNSEPEHLENPPRAWCQRSARSAAAGRGSPSLPTGRPNQQDQCQLRPADRDG